MWSLVHELHMSFNHLVVFINVVLLYLHSPVPLLSVHSCFLSLLLVAAVVWKIKQSCWASRRREVSLKLNLFLLFGFLRRVTLTCSPGWIYFRCLFLHLALYAASCTGLWAAETSTDSRGLFSWKKMETLLWWSHKDVTGDITTVWCGDISCVLLALAPSATCDVIAVCCYSERCLDGLLCLLLFDPHITLILILWCFLELHLSFTCRISVFPSVWTLCCW